MIFYTGDIHGDKTKIVQFWRHMNLTAEDAVAILGDAEINYEMRPAATPSYVTKQCRGGTVWYEKNYPNILFAKDGALSDIASFRSDYSTDFTEFCNDIFEDE